MAGSLAPVVYWGIRTTLCSAFVEQLPYQAVMHLVKILSMVQLLNLLKIWGPMPNLFSLLKGKMCCCALFMIVLVCLDHYSLLVKWTPLRNLKLLTRSTTASLMLMGACSARLFLYVVHDQLLCLAHTEGEVVVLAPHCQFSDLLPIGRLSVVGD